MDGFDASHGAYVRYPPRIACASWRWKSSANHCGGGGEDLGTVEPAVRDTLARFGILSCRVFYFEKNERGEVPPVRRIPAAGAGLLNHPRLATLAGFWVGTDIEARRRTGMIDEPSYRSQIEIRARDKQKDAGCARRDGIVAARTAPLRRRFTPS